MTISTNILEQYFAEFAEFITTKDKQLFTSFRTSKYIDRNENYKYSVYEEARENLGNKWWKPINIGTGKIQEKVNLAIKTKVIHSEQIVDNNLVDWRKKDDFSKRIISKTLEETLFNFYKSKIKDGEAFEQLVKEGLTYQFIAYLFFIKDSQRFLPISQERFDKIFDQIGLPEFKTRSNASWENYSEFCNIIKQVRDFLRTKDNNATLLDAHSFLWILGYQMKEDSYKLSNPKSAKQLEASTLKEEKKINNQSKVSELNSLMWIEILQNNKLTFELDLSIFQALYSFQEHKAYASQIALILETTHPPLNLEIWRYAKRISELYDINFKARNAGKYKFWDLFFNGWNDGYKFFFAIAARIS
jgi:hypothetical protein